MPISEVILISMALLTVAILAAGLFRHFSIPYTVLLVVIGIGLSELSRVWMPLQSLHEFRLTPELVFFVFLPALIFESGLSLNARQLVKDLAPVLTLAIPALLISTLLVGVGVWLLLDINLLVALLFGALISATDPVAVIALFKELGAPLRLNVLVEGESLFNDATAIVVFGILLSMLVEGSSINLASTGAAIIEFIRVFMGGALVGVLIGLLVSEMLYRLQSSISAIMTMSIVTAYGSFILAEHSLQVSGVMATVCSAVALSIYGLTRIPLSVKPILTETWEFIGLVANSLLFLLVGLSIDTSQLFSHSGTILLVVIIVQLARAASVYTLVPATVRLFNLPAVSLAERHIMWWGGLKGGLAIAIVLSIPESIGGKDLLINLTLGVVLFTLIVNAWSIRPIMHKLKLDRLTEDEALELEQGLRHAAKSCGDMLQRFTTLGIISAKLRNRLDTAINKRLTPQSAVLNAEQNFREVYLAAVRMESLTLDQLYQAGLISQYTLLDIRNTLQIDRDRYSRVQLIKMQSEELQQSAFQRLEMWVLRELREKNWAAVLLSHYQRRRLAQHIQRDIAGVVMSRAVIDMLASRDDLDAQASSEISVLYQHRFNKRQLRLTSLRHDFAGFFAMIEKDLFTRAALITAQVQVDHEHHHGELGVKAYNRISQTIKQVLQNLSSHAEDDNQDTYPAITAVPLFSGLSATVLKVLSEHAHSVTFLPGDIIIGEGDRGDALYIISQGRAEVSKTMDDGEKKILGELEQEDFFGEMALLGDHVRLATVSAITAVTLLRLTRSDVLKIADQHAEVKQRLEQARDERLIADRLV